MRSGALIILANFCFGIYHNASFGIRFTDKTMIRALISELVPVITNPSNYPVYQYFSYYGLSRSLTFSAYGTD